MSIDVANMVVNIGEQMQKVNWLEACVTFASVFLGAYFAYLFANRQEHQKEEKLKIENYNILWSKVALSLNNLFTYKEVYLDQIKQAFEKDDFKEALKTSYVPSSDFSFDEKHYFLNSYNRCFLTELHLLCKINDAAIEEIKSYYKNVFEVLYITENKKRLFPKEYERLKGRFISFYNEFEHLCARAYYLNKEFTKGFDKYFNLYSYDGIVNNFELEAEMTRRICSEESQAFVKEREAQFDIYWQIEQNIYCYICLWKRKFKHFFKFLVKFFQKPKICKQCRCCNLKKQNKDK